MSLKHWLGYLNGFYVYLFGLHSISTTIYEPFVSILLISWLLFICDHPIQKYIIYPPFCFPDVSCNTTEPSVVIYSQFKCVLAFTFVVVQCLCCSVFMLFKRLPLLLDAFSSVLVWYTELFWLNRIMNIKQRFTTVSIVLYNINLCTMFFLPFLIDKLKRLCIPYLKLLTLKIRN